MRLHILSILALASAAAIGSADLVGDYSITNGNPNGNWTYGSMNFPAGTFTAFTTSGTTTLSSPTPATLEFWSSTNAPALPMSYKLISGSLNGLNGGVGGINVGDVVLHPSASEFATARYTVPTTGLYDLDLWFGAGDGFTSNGNVDVVLVHNTSTLFSVKNTAIGGTFSSSLVNLAAGDTLDVMVGSGTDGFFYDSTPVNLKITAVPEPASLAVMGIGLAAISRRRKK